MKLLIPESSLQPVQAFLDAQNLSLELITAGQADVEVVMADEPKQTCSANQLYIEGRIACAQAFELAELLSIPRCHVGTLLDLLKIKIKACQLGCFK